MKDEIFEFIKKVQAIAHTGLTYSKDEYALDNYKELLEVSGEMLTKYLDLEENPYDIYKDFYYPTPQPCVRTFVVKDDKILFVKEALENKDQDKWSLPGGWCDIDTSSAEAAVKEVQEESGYDVKITKLLGIMDRSKYYESTMYNVYNIFYLAEVIGGKADPNFEVTEVGWFSIDDLPELSTKTTKDEILKIYNHYLKGEGAYYE